MARVVCPLCGEVTDVLVEGLCPNCFRALHPLVVQKREIRLEKCRVCGAFRLSGSRWSRDPEELEKEMLRKLSSFAEVKGEVRELSLNLEKGILRLKVLGKAHEALPSNYVEVHELRLKVSRAICETCLGYVSKKKTAIVQVRANGRELTPDEVVVIKNTLNKLSSLSASRGPDYAPVEVKEEPFGMDIYFSSSAVASEFVRMLSGKLHFDILETSKLIGVTSSGREKRRLTIRLLLPSFKRGDIVSIGDRLFLIDSIASGKIIVRDLETFEKSSLPLSRLNLSNIRVHVSKENLEEGVVVSNDGTSIYVMPSSGEILEVSIRHEKQAALFTPGGRVGILRRSGKIILVPRV
uniref:Nmd3 N-terminal domain-containing protein n=1 Tax=Thermofilum pendens TaxID=2269 RepID=A0A7C4FEE1_THEPE